MSLTLCHSLPFPRLSSVTPAPRSTAANTSVKTDTTCRAPPPTNCRNTTIPRRDQVSLSFHLQIFPASFLSSGTAGHSLSLSAVAIITHRRSSVLLVLPFFPLFAASSLALRIARLLGRDVLSGYSADSSVPPSFPPARPLGDGCTTRRSSTGRK